MKSRIITLLMALSFFAVTPTAMAQFSSSAPMELSYQGRLTDASGNFIYGDTLVDLTFKFYASASASQPLLVVVQSGVAVKDGLYGVDIGSGEVTPVLNNTLADVFQMNSNIWLGVSVNADPEMTPRRRITSVPYALTVDASWLDTFMSQSDYDGDGWTKKLYGGGDCNDDNPFIYPFAAETNCDGIDQDCDGADFCPQSTEYGWTRRFGGSLIDEGFDVALDGTGQILLAGYFQGTVNFGADYGTTQMLVSRGSSDIFITKLSWTYVDTKRIGGASSDQAYDVAIDGANNLYVTGLFGSTVDFARDFGGADLKTSAGGYDIFVTRINADGSHGWTRRIGGSESDSGKGVAVDNIGNVYVTGYFRGANVNFAADFGSTVDAKSSHGASDVFVTKLTDGGTYLWTRIMGGGQDDQGQDITADGTGTCYLTGYFMDSVDFGEDFGTSLVRVSRGFYDGMVARINADGSLGWLHHFGAGGWDNGDSIAVDPLGMALYVSGYFSSSVDFGDSASHPDVKMAAGSLDAFVMKLDAAHAYFWTRRLGGSNWDDGYAVAMDSARNAYVTGLFEGSADFGADFGITDIKYSGGSSDIFVTRINGDGTYGWTHRMGGTGADAGKGIFVDLSNSVYCTNRFQNLVDFGTDFDRVDEKTSTGSYDVFLTKIAQP